MTILEVIQRSADFLAKKGVGSPRLQVELFLAHVLKMPRLKLYLEFERVLTEQEVETLRELVRRRGQREPLQHILGSTSFCGLEMIVTRHVLVPRPETELLAERAWKFLSQIPAEHEPRALDLGTGSGCIAIALAAHASAARIDAVDLSGDALSTARQNVSKHLLTERIRLHQGDGFSALDPRSRYDLVVSNPPYIPTAEIQTLEPEVRDFDPSMALDGGADGMDFYRRIASGAAAFLRPGGMVMLELNDHGADNVAKIFQRARWKVESVEKDYNEFTRIFIARPAAQSHDVPA